MDKMILDTAKLKLEALEREVEELRAFLRTYNKLEKASSSNVESVKPSAAGEVNIVHKKRVVIFTPPSPREEIVRAARDVLKNAYPEPIHISILFDKLVSMGLVIGGRNPKGNLSAKLSKPKDLVYVKDKGWCYRPLRMRRP